MEERTQDEDIVIRAIGVERYYGQGETVTKALTERATTPTKGGLSS